MGHPRPDTPDGTPTPAERVSVPARLAAWIFPHGLVIPFQSVAHPPPPCAAVARGTDDQGGPVERNRCVAGERHRQLRGTGGLAVPGHIHAQESAHVAQGGSVPAVGTAERTHQDGRNGAGARDRRYRHGGNAAADLGSTCVDRRGRQIENQRGCVDGRALAVGRNIKLDAREQCREHQPNHDGQGTRRGERYGPAAGGATRSGEDSGVEFGGRALL